MVVKGSLTNPRELADNRLGGLINTTRPDGVVPMAQPPLNPFVFQTLQQLQDNLEENTGVSSLSTGMNKDAVSKQNSAALVEQLTSMSQQRQKIIARNFANQFVKPLFREIYAGRRERRPGESGRAGRRVRPDQSSLEREARRDGRAASRLRRQEKEAQKLLQITPVQPDPSLQPLYSPENRYSMMKSILEAQGI